jgi:hypothetical protein
MSCPAVRARVLVAGFWRHPLQIPRSCTGGELSPRPWHDPALYAATAPLQARWKEILAEVEATLGEGERPPRQAGDGSSGGGDGDDDGRGGGEPAQSGASSSSNSSFFAANAEDATLVGAGTWAELRLYNLRHISIRTGILN